MNQATERACLQLVVDDFACVASTIPGVQFAVLGVAMVCVPGRNLVTSSMHVLPPVDGLNGLSGTCDDPSSPTPVGDCGMVRVNATIPGLATLSAIPEEPAGDTDTRLYVLVYRDLGGQQPDVQVTRFAAPDSCLDFVDQDRFVSWALAST